MAEMSLATLKDEMPDPDFRGFDHPAIGGVGMGAAKPGLGELVLPPKLRMPTDFLANMTAAEWKATLLDFGSAMIPDYLKQPPPFNMPETPGKIPRVSWSPQEVTGLAAFDLASLVGAPLAKAAVTLGAKGGAAVARALRPQATTLGSRSINMYDPPALKPRPFKDDYRKGARSDAAGNLIEDIEGRPLIAETVVGRRVVGGPDHPFPPEKFDDLAKALTGTHTKRVPEREMEDSLGRTLLDDQVPRQPVGIDLRSDLAHRDGQRAYAHELGHVIDQIAGEIPTEKLMTELRPLYHTLSTGQERRGRLTVPESFGYSEEEVPRELMAEAIRAYLANPNYIKIRAPKTAEAIRTLNEHPIISKYVQFNSLAPMLGGAAGAGSVPMLRDNAQSNEDAQQ